MKIVVLTLAAAALLAVPAATAAPPTLSIDENPVARGDTFTLSGCGYPAPTALSFKVVGPGILYFTADEPLTDSCFSEAWTAWWPSAGDYQITSYYRNAKGMTKKAGVVKFTVT